MLKAKISQVKSNLYAVKTTKYDTTDIELTVETADSSPWLNPSFELLGIKPDGHEVHQTENFKVVDLNNHIVQVTLDEQFVTCEGNVDLQLLIKDDSRKSSTPFKLFIGRSLDSDILESHRNVKVLDELEKYIIEGREYISEATKLAQSTANYVQAVNTQAEANEAQRLQNESQRQSAETKRKEAEDDRKQAEVLRVQNEDTRQSAEVTRIANEQTRLENESNRIERETARENKESIRQAQEQKRHNAESTRQSQEATRQSNEDNREQSEKSRSQEETIRINSEAIRKQTEDARQSQELDRQSAESARRTAETNRNNAESTRAQNENTRKSQETTRQQKETERQSAEATRQQKEVERQTEETKRLEAEELRKEAYIEARQLLDELQDFEPITEKDRTDYMGNLHQTLKKKNDADVEWLLGEVNTAHYEGQQITATNTLEGRSKSAILKGQTLVNLLDMNNLIQQDSATYVVPLTTMESEITIIATNKTVNKSPRLSLCNEDGSWVRNENTSLTNNKIHYKAESGLYVKKLVFTTNNVASHPYSYESLEQFKEQGFIVIEGNYENGVSSYFEGMQSVKMPVLTTTGKNLFDVNSLKGLNNKVVVMNGEITINNSYANVLAKEARKAFNLLKPNKTYHYSCTVTNTGQTNEISGGFYFGKTSADGATTYFTVHPNRKFTTPSDWENYTSVIIYGAKSNDGIITVSDMQFEESSVATPYEPYKTNILSTSEDVVLRGIGDVKDTLDCLTGELTQRIGEHIIDGNEHWATYDGYSVEGYKSFITTITGLNNLYTGTTAFISGDLKMESWNGYTKCTTEEMVWNHDPNAIGIKVKNETASNVEELKTFLASNPISFQYELATESIKTVDLSDNHVYSYKDVTHYDCSSAEGSLVPTLSIDVPTNLSALVSRQRKTIDTQKEQIVSLEKDNEELVSSQAIQDEEIVTSMLASAELFEMVLSMMPASASIPKSMEVNPMVEVYVTLILKGEKTIEQVPAVIRDKVQAQLDLLTK